MGEARKSTMEQEIIAYKLRKIEKKGGGNKKAEIEANQFRLSNYIKIISNNFCR